MIKYNNSNINDWNFGEDNIIKVYRNNAIVFYKFDSETQEFKVCYAVVADITQYTDREFEDVYDKATEKWYKLNNLNNYEEYGVYGSGRTDCGSAPLPSYKYWLWRSVEKSTSDKLIQFSEFDLVANGSDVNLTFISGLPSGFSGEGPANLFDNNINTKYCANLSSYLDSNYILFEAPSAISPTTFSMTTANDSADYKRHPDVWALYGSNTSTTDWTDGSWDMVLSGTCGDEMCVNYTRFDYAIHYQGECVTTYEGKLTIDDGYEYIYSGNSWVNVGEISGSSRVPSGYVELTYAQTVKQYVGSSSAFTIPMDLEQDYKYMCEFTPLDWETSNGSYYGLIGGGIDGYDAYTKWGLFKLDNGWGTMYNRFDACFWTYRLSTNNNSGVVGAYRFYDNVRAKVTMHLHNYSTTEGSDIVVENEGYSTYSGTSTIKYGNYTVQSGSYNMPLFCRLDGGSTLTAYIKFHGLKVETSGGTPVYEYVPCKRESDNKVGLYDVVNNAFYAPDFLLNAGDEASGVTYPMYYDEKQDPLDNLTFTSTTQAEDYAYNNCVYDGMKATIDGNRYVFDSEEGWVYVPEYYKVEDVTPNQASGWTISGSSTYNPDPSYYDDFDLETTSTSNSYKIAKVTIFGYDHFTYYLRSSAYSDSYGYVVASNIDELSTDPTSMSYTSNSAITNTYSFRKAAGSAVNLSNYRRVTYNNLDKTVEHTFYVVFYGRTYSSYKGNATILIPKSQANENWEQVTFSASSNVASSQKNLYIDGSSSTNGGTSYWYYRWMVGLPSGSHTSYTNFSSYNYCPNVTSSTFTSVAGEQRQVNFTYNDTSNKSLSFRLTDGSNVLTPSDTVYYNMTYYNSCGASSSSSNVTFPRSQSVKVGGSFSFSNSSNRHYIYGYQPPTLGTRYYVDNYQSTFDITYTKLSEEAVTITYTTYDPNDSETPAFKTDITWPYSGGTTSSTTLTSYDVPYTYSYTVSQTNGMFSADSQSYTANQAARTINFVLYPNNREFASVADMEAYQYAWEGMKVTVNGTKYQYKNGEWVENQHSLPDVPFVLNYNAKNYDATTHSIPMTTGQLNGTDAVAYRNPNNIVDHSADGYITISNSSMRARKENQDISLFNRSSNSTSSDLTIVCKAKTTSGENIITNRDSSYNWMYRLKTSGILTLHGTSETGSLAWNTSNPDIMSVRTYYDSGTKVKYNNWTQNTVSTPTSFTYGSTNGDTSRAGALFVGYSWNNTSEQWSGDFYWVYMAQANLTDSQIQEVIDYNENL